MCRQRTIIFMWQNYVWGGLQFSFHTFWSYITPCWRVSKTEKRQREGEIEKKKARFIGNVYLSKAVQIKGRLLASCRHSERQLPLPHFRHHEKWVWSPKDHEPKVCRVRRRPYVRVAERERGNNGIFLEKYIAGAGKIDDELYFTPPSTSIFLGHSLISRCLLPLVPYHSLCQIFS